MNSVSMSFSFLDRTGNRSIKTPTCRSHLSFGVAVEACLKPLAIVLPNKFKIIFLYLLFSSQRAALHSAQLELLFHHLRICPINYLDFCSLSKFTMSGLNNGLLIITCLSKLAASLSVASKRIVNHLYIHYQPNEPLKYEKFSKVRKLTPSFEFLHRLMVKCIFRHC